MGHTLVTRFEARSRKLISDLMAPFDANKIPYGRDCDREAANRELDYHMTVLHWAKNRDAYYLECLKDFRSMPCALRVTGVRIMAAEAGSWLLYLAVEPEESYLALAERVEQQTSAQTSRFFHITLAVSPDRDEILEIRRHIESRLAFPLELQVEGLDLYHIWRPTKKVGSC